MFNAFLRVPLRKFLLAMLRWTEKTAVSGTVVRSSRMAWQKEINLPMPAVAVLSIGVFFVVLFLEVGLSASKVAGLVVFLTMVFVFLAVYLNHDQPEMLADSEAIMLLGLLLVSAVVTMRLFKNLPLAAPISAFPLLTGLLLSRRLAVMTAIVLCLVFGVLNDFGLEYFFVPLAGSFAGVAALARVRNRIDVTRIGLKIAFVNMAAITAIHLFSIWSLGTFQSHLLLGAASGVMSGLIVLGVLPYLETFFSRTTNIKLLELADFTQPLLKQLTLEAPGTYHHSLIMASLAEQAAEAIGANSLLARVGAYYHDIGKLVKPEYFIENQQTMGNPHDPLTPTMSSLVVISHVKEGVELAHKHNLDRIIIDCIEQHHGTSLIHYFYHRALEQNAQITPDSFRYPGPRPRSKVAAILMLADAVEAASRTIEEPSAGRIKDLVEKIINNKFTDGQFAESPITLNDLSKIAESLAASLSGLYHARIEYQKTENGAKAQ
ncbi:MAG: hypothetical protein A2219_06315 [Elusimicrobia bacterium RIFOXYA2_FULL_50_26]|nr:MAG: hypothetical protein A2219_06315 [Elusimicrobia bacterium RIFOXYA2_FULL_50_26]